MHVCVYTCVFIATPYMYTYTYAVYVTCGEKGPEKYPCSCLTRLRLWVYPTSPPRAPPWGDLQLIQNQQRSYRFYTYLQQSDTRMGSWNVHLLIGAPLTGRSSQHSGPPEATPPCNTPPPDRGSRLTVYKGIRTSQISTVCVNVCLI